MWRGVARYAMQHNSLAVATKLGLECNHLTMCATTLAACCFLQFVVFVLVLVTFGLLGHVTFGFNSDAFRSFGNSMLSVMQVDTSSVRQPVFSGGWWLLVVVWLVVVCVWVCVCVGGGVLIELTWCINQS